MAEYPIPKGEQLQTMTTAERVAETRRVQAENILRATGDQRYRRAFAQVASLKAAGWEVTIWDAQDGVHVSNGRPASGPHLCVTFTAPGDCRCTGSVGADGSLSGEPLD